MFGKSFKPINLNQSSNQEISMEPTKMLNSFFIFSLIFCLPYYVLFSTPFLPANAAIISSKSASKPSSISQSIDMNDITRFKKGLREIDFLLSNWDKKTIYCNFGELQRDLLSNKNKDKLIAAAAVGGLLDYDKSATMNVVCRQDPEIVRAFVGLTNENLTLKNADLLMKKPSTLNIIYDNINNYDSKEDEVNSDDIVNDYMEAVDTYSQAIAAIDGLAYTARTDFSSTETSFKNDNSNQSNKEKNNYLEQSRKEVIIARNSLEKIVKYLHIQ
eukprot:gene5056-7058_t